MKFKEIIAIVALLSMAAQAGAQDGTLRRMAQNDNVSTETTGEAQTKQGVIILNTNTNTNSNMAATIQPATIVEAQPVVESKAEQLRKARQASEINTEQKIVEKLEESRLKDEQDRADRLFGNKLDSAQSAALQEAAANPGGKLAPAPAAPVPAQVTIEKVEIIQPAPPAPVIVAPAPAPVVEVKPAPAVEVAPVAAPAPEAKTMMAAPVEAKPKKASQMYVSGALGGATYDASNVKSNFSGGFAVGTLVNERMAVEGAFTYSNHYIDTFWNPGIYREMDQYDIGINAKYFLLDQKIKPYIGAGVAYIFRNYSQRIRTYNGQSLAGPDEEETQAVNLNLLAGADFQMTDSFLLGGGVEYSTNIMNRDEFNFNNYGYLPPNTRALEEIDFWTIKVTGTFTF